jgi:hypothetical protein
VFNQQQCHIFSQLRTQEKSADSRERKSPGVIAEAGCVRMSSKWRSVDPRNGNIPVARNDFSGQSTIQSSNVGR